MSAQKIPQKVHFIGICGAGMSATAILLKELGHEVSGSDENFYPPVSTYLDKSGINYHKGYGKKNIPEGVGMFVIGKHAGLTPKDNEEVKNAFESGLPIKSFAEVLGYITRKKKNIVVAGSYGKSTCSALLAWCLECAGKLPGYFIGAIPKTPKGSSRFGKGKNFVLEGDEYPSSNWDTNSKFLHYHPNHLLLTSLSHDHLNVFRTEKDYRAPFKKLINLIPANGLIVACIDGEGIKKTLKNSRKVADKKVVYYSLKNRSSWHAENIEHGDVSSFDLFSGARKIIGIKTILLGNHNIENVVGVSAALLTLGLITPRQLSRAISKFQPLQRRLDKKSDKTGIPIYEGFGSSRDKAKSAIDALKARYPKRKLIVLFEPHTFSWRDRRALSWYDSVFSSADKVIIYKAPEDGPKAGWLSLAEITSRVRKNGVDVIGFNSATNVLKDFKKSINDSSSVLILSSGGFGGIIEKVVRILEEKFPK